MSHNISYGRRPFLGAALAAIGVPDPLEAALAHAPVISIPAVTLQGDAGAPHPDGRAYAKKFSGPYAHRVVTGGVGHKLPQEAPRASADAVMDVDRRPRSMQ